MAKLFYKTKFAVASVALILALLVCSACNALPPVPTSPASPSVSTTPSVTPTTSPSPTVSNDPLCALFDFSLTADGYEVTAYYGNTDVVAVPETYEGVPVTSICEGAFIGKTEMTELHLPKHLTKVGTEFMNCTKIRKITLPIAVLGQISMVNTVLESVVLIAGTELPASAFLGCGTLDSIVLPDNLQKIGESAFSGCFSLISIYIPASVTEIGGFAFANCMKLVEIKNDSTFDFAPFTAGAGQLGESAMNVYSSASGQSKLTFVDNYAFVTDDDGTTWLSSYVGHEKELTLPTIGKPYKINYRAFFSTGDFTSVTIPEGVTEIGREAFYGCGNILHFDFPSTLEYIDYSAIFNCAYVESATYTGTIHEWESIEKDFGWNLHSYRFPIYCTDGVAYSRAS